MAVIDESLVGSVGEQVDRSWNSTDVLLYALAVGAGQQDPSQELAFTTENSQGVVQQVLPTFAATRLTGGAPLPPEVDLASLLHAEEAFELYAPLPVEGRVTVSDTIVAVYDKGADAVVVNESSAVAPDGTLVATVRASVFVRGHGGFGGPRGGEPWERPTGAPDHQVVCPTRPDQALLYRLTGDRNPLHSDPTVAVEAGFPGPILHGMCTYGVTGRVLLHAVAGSQAARFRAMCARFTRPVTPGEILTVSMWIDGETVRFRTVDESGAAVIDRGVARISA